jgi:acyl CoA:acetate/3-ketoacid CoA transferase beta subunit
MIRTLAFPALILGAYVSLGAQMPVNAPRQYDPAAEVTTEGVIVGVIAIKGSDGTVGVHLNLMTAGKVPVKVHLGPAMFIGMNDAAFFAEDPVAVTGAFVSHDGEVALWARQSTKNGKTLMLRGPDGTPRWPFATADDPDGCGVSHDPVRY